jgi:cell division protein FtsI/penicillin-binding protein 2
MPMQRTWLLLAGGVALAGLGVASGTSAETAAEIAGPALDPAAAAPPAASVSASPEARSPKPEAPPPPRLDLDHIARAGDHFEAAYGDKRAVLTLDPDLQDAAEKLLAEAHAPRGAIVAMAPDGRILALAGRRTEDPKGKGDGTLDWHLATDVWAPAASVFKLVTSSALVEHGVDPDDKICFHGGIRSVVESNLRDDKRDNQCQSLAFGVAHSNNAILGKLAYQHLEPADLEREAHDLLGVDQTFGGALAALGVKFGALELPTDHDLAFAQASAGFAGSQLSALGGATLAATFANGGEQPMPRLVASDAPSMHRAVDGKIARAVGHMMEGACEFGSASKSFGRHRKIAVAGKTGTLTQEQPFYMQYSWFVGYAPADKPEIIVSVVLGNPESWQMKGHEVAQKLIDRAMRRAEDRDDTTAKRQRKHLQW